MIKTIEDIEAIEQTPFEDQQLPASTYAYLQQGAAINPDAPALTFFAQAKDDLFKDSETYSYRAFMRHIHQTGNMMNDLGIGPEDVVSMVLPNLPEAHFTIWGTQTTGIVNPINPLLEAHQIKEILQAAKTSVLVTIAPFPNTDIWEKIDSIRHELPDLKTILRINIEDHLSGIKKWAVRAMMTLKRRAKPILDQTILDFNQFRSLFPMEGLSFQRNIQPTDIAAFFHTGGTTGTPKLARHTHRNEVYDSWAMLKTLGMSGAGVNFFCGLPLFHVNGVMVTGLGPFGSGAHVVLGTPSGYRGEGLMDNFWRIVEHYKLSFFSGVPTVYSTLLNKPIKEADISSLQYAICGAAPMPVEVFRNFEKMTGVRIVEGYGCTEGTCASAVNPPGGDRRIGSIGYRFPYQEMKTVILDEEGKYARDAAIDEIGIVAIRGYNVFAGYTEERFNQQAWIDTGDGQGPFYNTGDLGRMDQDQYFWLTGRKKELIIRGGHNIDPKMIEEPLSSHPQVELVAAVGRPDPRVGEIPVAFVQLKPGAATTVPELMEFAQTHIGERAAIPKHIHIMESLPVTAVGKIFKPDLIYLEVKEVFQEEMAQMSTVETCTVTVGPDNVHGMLAQLDIHPKSGTDPASVEREIHKILGAYSVKYVVKISAAVAT
ncbi:acyl-CoA synthetase [Pontibacter sp. G13]|uniref:acyl-CoA synthetase n=1 Tax=Pontibacter sp. G13 TaxID=3074898 RepID=UPI00288B22AD|nr:acyl-CoA synthetase [Pontibacter sp. G13]WNJ16764.1 acyl-CoA synthetase [Pontibacter sp. G13]